MKLIHLTSSKTYREGTYSFRIYSYDGSGKPREAGAQFPIGSLAQHYNLCSRLKPTAIPSSAIKTFGSHEVTKEGEVSQGIPEIANLKMECHAVPELQEIVDAVRDPDVQVWIEVVLEQHVEDAEVRPGHFLAPRKQRMFFWGRLEPLETTGRVVAQERLERGLAKTLTWKELSHKGTIELTFVHWLRVVGGESPKDFLDRFRAPYTGDGTVGHQNFFSCSKLLYDLLAYLSPTPLFAATDFRLRHLQERPGQTDLSKGQMELTLPFYYEDGTGLRSNTLEALTLPARQYPSLYSPLLFSDAKNGNGDKSLYECENLLELLIRWSAEFKLFPQVEIPTLEEAFEHFGGPIVKNIWAARMKNWLGTTRWLFTAFGRTTIDLYADANQDSIEYTPATAATGTYKVEMPSREDLLPAPSYSIATGLYQGKQESYKTLLRLVGYGVNPDNSTFDDPMSIELVPDWNSAEFIRKIICEGQEFDNWSAFHAWFEINVWGRVKAMLKFTSHGVAIEPFGANDTGEQLPPARLCRKTYGFGDFGDFPILRRFTAKVGLLSELAEFALMSIKREPGGNAELTLLEFGAMDTVDGRLEDAPPPDAPPPDPPTDTTPPTINIDSPTGGSTISGTTNVRITANDDSGIGVVKLYWDGKFYDVLNYPDDPVHTTRFTFSVITTQFTDGFHTITAQAFDTAGNRITSAAVLVNVSNSPP